MSRSMKRAVWASASVCFVVLAGVGLVRSSGHPAPQQEASLVPLQRPGQEQWVPFTATLNHVNDFGRVAVGRFYQASDGSTRSETGPSLNEINIIGIKNIR